MGEGGVCRRDENGKRKKNKRAPFLFAQAYPKGSTHCSPFLFFFFCSVMDRKQQMSLTLASTKLNSKLVAKVVFAFKLKLATWSSQGLCTTSFCRHFRRILPGSLIGHRKGARLGRQRRKWASCWCGQEKIPWHEGSGFSSNTGKQISSDQIPRLPVQGIFTSQLLVLHGG